MEQLSRVGTNKEHTGTFNVNGHAIRRLNVTVSESAVGGLFGVIEDASLENLALEDINMKVILQIVLCAFL